MQMTKEEIISNIKNELGNLSSERTLMIILLFIRNEIRIEGD